MMSMDLSNFAILSIKGSDYCSIISLIIKNEAIKCFTLGDIKIEKNKNFIAIRFLSL